MILTETESVKIPKHILELAPYKPGKPGANMFGDIKPELEVVLSSNENNYGLSPKAAASLTEELHKCFLYPDPVAAALKNKLASILGINTENITVSNGSDAILYTMFKAFVSPGESLLTSHGAFVSAAVMARMHDVPCKLVPMKAGYEFDLHGILEAIDDTTKLIYLVNPNNPTGAMIRKDDMVSFLDNVPRHILVVVDEAYKEFAEDLSSDYPDCAKMGYSNVIVLRTFSKAYGMAGLRLGYAIGPAYLISALSKVKLTFDPNLAAQIAGLAALDDNEFLEKTIANNSRERAKLFMAYKGLGLKYTPSYGNFIMLDLESEARVEAVYEALRQKGILTRRLASFGIPQGLRVSIGREFENDYYLNKLEIVLSELQFV